MPLYLHTIKSTKGTTKKKKRVGRGNSSGHGTYSTRGLKGQKSRSGVSNLKRLGLKKQLLAIPKKRGFKSDKPKAQVINVIDLNKHFRDNDVISPKILIKKQLIDSLELDVKLLGKGELKIKGLKLEGIKVSASVKTQIEKMNGSIK